MHWIFSAYDHRIWVSIKAFAVAVVLMIGGLFTLDSFAQCAPCQASTGNLIENGDFSDGNTGFTTDLVLATGSGPWGPLSNPNTYGIDSDASNQHFNFSGFDNTDPPNGLFFIANGSTAANADAWCQTVDVDPNTEYTLSFWAMNVDGVNGGFPGELALWIDGVEVIAPELIEGGWEELTGTWNSGGNTSVEVCIKDVLSAGPGNDYGFDDIWMYNCTDVVPQPIDAGPDLQVCSGESIDFEAVEYDGYEYLWLGPAGLDNNGAANPSVTLINDGTAPVTYTYTLELDTADTGCPQIDEVNVTVIPLPVVDLGEDEVICPGEQVALSVGAGWDAVEWNTNETTLVITVDQAGTYSVTVTELGCSSSDEVEVLTPDLPVIELGDDQEICEDEEIEFDIGVEGIWSDGTTSSTYTASSTETIWVDYFDLGCLVTDTVDVTSFNYPILDLGPDHLICPHDTITLMAQSLSTWSTGQQDEFEIDVSEAGLYSASAANGPCVSTDEVLVEVIPYPEVELGVNSTTCWGESVKLENEFQGDWECLWSTGDTTETIRIKETGFYLLSATNECATITDTVYWFFEECDYYVYIPNAITPDNDGLNDVLEISTINMKYYDLFIYDRWGQQVFHGTDDSHRWNANLDGGQYYVENDMYFYRFAGLSEKKQIVERYGWITVIR